MPTEDNWRVVHKFLEEHFRSQEPFTQAALFAGTTWTGQSPKTYWSKQIRQFVTPVDGDKYRVSQAFRRVVRWESFQKHATQMRSMVTDAYTYLTYDNVLIYEFFMPLTNEDLLRSSLDALFYKETLIRGLKTLDPESLKNHFPLEAGETFEEYVTRCAEWLSGRIGGYSISHVNGRFKAGDLSTFAEAALLQEQGGRYLIDETTAVVRFIFPCGKPLERKPPLTTGHFEEVGADIELDAGADEDAANIRWFFGVLFVKSIVEVVNGEAEIWMVESGMRYRLHIWRVES
jgi:hypothetical protein